jgi:putative membrane protein
MSDPQRLHPLTVLFRGGGRGLSIASFVFFFGGAMSSAIGGALGLSIPFALLAGPLAALALVGTFAYEYARYLRFEYELTADTLDIRSGVFARRDREIPLRRIQNVDISRSVVGRALGLATVEIETAGGGETEANLQYVGFDVAEALQEDIRTGKVRAERRETDSADAEAERETVTPEPDERELLFELDTDDLLLVSALTADLRIVPVLLFVGPAVAPAITGFLDLDTGVSLVVVLLAVVGVAMLAVAAWTLSAVSTFVQFYDFRLSRVGDDLRYERGLLQRYDGAIPLSKIQTVTVEENVLMRRFGYAALSVETAGYAPGAAPSGGSEAAVPLAGRGRVYDLAADIEGISEPDVERPPERARRRYVVRYGLLAVVLAGVGFAVSSFVTAFPWYLVLVLLVVAPVAARYKWVHRGRALGADHVVTRNGFWSRTTRFVPYYRVQTAIDRRTIFQRRWRLASVVVDTAGSTSLTGADAVAADIDDGDAERFRTAVIDRLRTALAERLRGDEETTSSPGRRAETTERRPDDGTAGAEKD